MIINATTTAQHINTLCTAIIDSAKSGLKLAKIIKEICTPPASIETASDLKDFQEELACILTSARAESDKAAQFYIDVYLSKREALQIETFKKSVTNSWTYARKIAGEAAGCEFKFEQQARTFSVKERKAVNEPATKQTNGKEKGLNTAVHQNASMAFDLNQPTLPALPAEKDKSKAAKQARAARLLAAKAAVEALFGVFSVEELGPVLESVYAEQAEKAAAEDMARLLAEPPVNQAAA